MNHRYCRIIFAGYYTVKFLNELIDLLVKILTLFNYFLPKKQMSFPLWSHRYKSKKGKWIYIPTDECRIKWANIIRLLSTFWHSPSYFYHLQKGSHIAAIKLHLYNGSDLRQIKNSRYFSYFDITNFFGSINKNKIIKATKCFVGYQMAKDIANASTVTNIGSSEKVLPFGFVQSPLIGSIVLDQSYLGRELSKLSKLHNLKLSVFVDDIIISSDNKKLIQSASERILKAIEKSNLHLNQEKSSICNGSMKVFNIFAKYNCLYLTEHRLTVFAEKLINNSSDYFVVEGIVNYMKMVSPHQSKRLIKEIVCEIGTSRAGFIAKIP